MIYYITLIISFFFIALIIKNKRFVFYVVAQSSVSLVNELISDLDEDAKINLIQKSTNKLLGILLKLFLVIGLAIIIGSIPMVIYCFVWEIEFQSLNFTSVYSILAISAGATIPFVIPLKKRKETNYSELSQLLHRMALDNYHIADKLFKKETKKIKKRDLKIRTDFVIVSGLARAGTTSLMNNLSKIEDFKSLSYANMPFLMCPNIWAKFYRPKDTELKERSHKDGIMVGLNSNEALEEYFFKVKAHDSYIFDSHLSEYIISQEDYNSYLDYQTIIKLDNQKVYLAKNNNFLLRYKSVRALNDKFLMIFLYRDPLTHASSLLEKHLYYKDLQKEDTFILEYMNWLGHHEFGLNQKPFIFGDAEKCIEGDKDTLDYWLKVWINYYSYVITINHINTILINYDLFCKNPGLIIDKIVIKAGIETGLPDNNVFNNKRKAEGDYTQSIFDIAQDIYNSLLDSKLNI